MSIQQLIRPHRKRVERCYWFNVENQRNFMKDLFVKLNLSSTNDWKNVNKFTIQKNGGGEVVKYYKRDIKLLLRSLYPEHDWNFSNVKEKRVNYWNQIENQKQFMDNLFIKLNLKTLEDWKIITKNQIYKLGGQSIVKHFKYNMKDLLSTIYPDYKWSFKNLKVDPKEKWQSLEYRKEFMESIFIKMKLQGMDDWLSVSRNQIREKGGSALLRSYSNDLKLIFSSIFPNYPWDFTQLKYDQYHINEKIKKKIADLIHKYMIQQKKDWYRIHAHKSFNLLYYLKKIYPDEKWNKKVFLSRNKKTNQRILYVNTSQIFANDLIYENYYHPSLSDSFNSNLEFDIFIPSRDIALEYQGEQHYEEIPAVFGQWEECKERDILKKSLSLQNNVKLIQIPFWWDQSTSSLMKIIL